MTRARDNQAAAPALRPIGVFVWRETNERAYAVALGLVSAALGCQTRRGHPKPHTGVKNGDLGASWAVWTGRKGTFRPKCSLSRSLSGQSHPKGRSAAEDGASR